MFKPLRDFLVVEKFTEEEKTPGGLIFRPATAEAKTVKGRVLAAGTGTLTSSGTVVPLETHVGDTVVFNKNYAIEVTEGNETVLLLREEHIICVLTPTTAT